MLDYNPNKHLISLHLAKTGGTSFGEILREWFIPNFYYHYINEQNEEIPPKAKLKKWGVFPIKEVCIHGHFENAINRTAHDFYPNSTQFISIMRKPIEQSISLFNFQKKIIKKYGGINYRGIFYTRPIYQDINSNEYKTTESLDEFLAIGKSPLLKHLNFNVSKENFKTIIDNKFIHIGSLNTFENSIKIIAQKLDKPYPKKIPTLNQNKCNFDISKNQEKIFNKNHFLENEIYNYIHESI